MREGEAVMGIGAAFDASFCFAIISLVKFLTPGTGKEFKFGEISLFLGWQNHSVRQNLRSKSSKRGQRKCPKPAPMPGSPISPPKH